jgi:hypothetical protein
MQKYLKLVYLKWESGMLSLHDHGIFGVIICAGGHCSLHVLPGPRDTGGERRASQQATAGQDQVLYFRSQIEHL